MNLVSVKEARGMLGVSSRTLSNYVMRGALREYRLPGNHRRFELSELEGLVHEVVQEVRSDEAGVGVPVEEQRVGGADGLVQGMHVGVQGVEAED